MKTLYLVRHAKSSWADPGMRDFDRPLNERGMRNAPFMAGMFKQRGEPVDMLVSSPANRAISTARFFAKELGVRPEQLREEPGIYEAERSKLVRIVNALPDGAERVMLFGHNPGFSEVLEYLSESGSGDMPTCAIARIDLLVDAWSAVGKSTGTLVWLDYPKRHPGQG